MSTIYEQEPQSHRVSRRWPSLAVVAGLAAIGFAALIASFVSFGSVVGTISGGGRNDDQLLRGADSLARNFGGIVVRLRFCASALLFAALAAAMQRARIQTWIEEAVVALPRFLRSVPGMIGRGLRADGAFHIAALAALTSIGAAVRYRYLFLPMRIDEAETYLSYASRPLYIGLSWYPAPNNHLFHTLLVHFVCSLFGGLEWVIRMPAFVSGILLIPLTYWAGRALYDKHSALIAAGLVAGASSLVHYSVDGRGYSIVCGAFLLLLPIGQHLLAHDSQPAWLVWALCASVGLYTIPTMLYAAGTATVWLVFASGGIEKKEDRRRFLVHLTSSVALTAGLTALLYLPVVIASGWKPLFSNSFVAAKGLAYFWANIPRGLLQAWELLTADVAAPLVWFLVLCFAVGLVFYRTTAANRFAPPVAAGLVIPIVLLAQRVIPYARVWLFLVPLAAIVAGAGLWVMVRGFEAHSFVSIAIALACLAGLCVPDFRGGRLAYRIPSDGAENVARWMKGHLTPGDVVVAQGLGWTPLTYYFRRHGVPLVNRPSPCDYATLIYTSKGGAGRNPGRVLTISGVNQNPSTVLSGACMAWQASPIPDVVYQTLNLRVHQGLGVRVAPGRREKQ